MALLAYIFGGLYGCGLLILLIHEMGHVLAGRVVHYRVHVLKIGPVCMVNEDNKWRLLLAKNIFSGFVTFHPPSHERMIRDEMIVGAGGIISNLICGIGLVAIYFMLREIHENSLLIIVGSLSIFMGLVNLLPMKGKTFVLHSDGLKLLELFKMWRNNSDRQGK